MSNLFCVCFRRIFHLKQEGYGEERMAYACVFHWPKVFSEGGKSVVDEHLTGWPLSSNSDILMITAVVII